MSIGCASSNQLFKYSNNPVAQNIINKRVVPVYMDKSFTNDERIQILSAIGEWNYALNNSIKMDVQSTDIDNSKESVSKLLNVIEQTGQGYLLLRLTHDDSRLKDIIDPDDGTLAFVNSLGNNGHLMVVLSDRIGNRDLKTIVEHEFGHLLGCMHTLAKSLMYPSYGGGSSYPCIDKISMLQVANYNKIDPRNMNYCAVPDLP